MSDRFVSIIPFVDGVLREVFLDADGRQFVYDDAGERVYGVWVLIEEPVIVGRTMTPQLGVCIANG